MKALLYISTVLFLFMSCSHDDKAGSHMNYDANEIAETKYTCPMHPEVIQNTPGKCPICGMDLVKKNTASQLMLNDTEMKLANITTQKVSRGSFSQAFVANSKVVVDEERTEVISSRAAGRIEKLFVKETGHMVKKGEPLYELYSETLLTLQREYLLANDQFQSLGRAEPRYESFLKAAERKLLLYGLTKGQIEQLAKSKELQNRISFLAPASGIVTQIDVSDGQYINEGTRLYRLEDINTLWIETELYPNEESLIKDGDVVKVVFAGMENSPAEATVTFISREYRANSQITLVRSSIRNPALTLKPGMQAQVFLSHSLRASLTVPVDAVIRDAKGAHVYVQTDDYTFEPRMVKIGNENFEQVEILEGLSENEVVVVTGAYLLYSELILKRGTDPMASHTH